VKALYQAETLAAQQGSIIFYDAASLIPQTIVRDYLDYFGKKYEALNLHVQAKVQQIVKTAGPLSGKPLQDSIVAIRANMKRISV
jgi:hypothetical protein